MTRRDIMGNEYLNSLKAKLKEGQTPLPTGYTLYWKTNEVGGRTYISDEVGGGVTVWDTALVSSSSLLAAIGQEETLTIYEYHTKKKEDS